MDMFNYNTTTMGQPATFVYEDNYDYMTIEPYKKHEYFMPPEPYDFHYPYFWPSYSMEWKKQQEEAISRPKPKKKDSCNCKDQYYSKSQIETLINQIKTQQSQRDQEQDEATSTIIENQKEVDSVQNQNITKIKDDMAEYIQAQQQRDSEQDVQMSVTAESIAQNKIDDLVNRIQEGELIINTEDGIQIWNDYSGEH